MFGLLSFVLELDWGCDDGVVVLKEGVLVPPPPQERTGVLHPVEDEVIVVLVIIEQSPADTQYILILMFAPDGQAEELLRLNEMQLEAAKKESRLSLSISITDTLTLDSMTSRCIIEKNDILRSGVRQADLKNPACSKRQKLSQDREFYLRDHLEHQTTCRLH